METSCDVVYETQQGNGLIAYLFCDVTKVSLICNNARILQKWALFKTAVKFRLKRSALFFSWTLWSGQKRLHVFCLSELGTSAKNGNCKNVFTQYVCVSADVFVSLSAKLYHSCTAERKKSVKATVLVKLTRGRSKLQLFWYKCLDFHKKRICEQHTILKECAVCCAHVHNES